MAGIRVPLDSDDLRRRYLAGESKTSLAREFGVSPHVIAHRLAEVGIPVAASHSEARRIMYDRMTPDERASVTVAAHDAVRGMKRTVEDRERRAIGVESVGKFGSEDERMLCGMLRKRGCVVVPQKAVGVYNIDLATESVAVECFGSWPKGAARARIRERTEYILNAGWTLVVVWSNARYWKLTSGAADYIVTLMEQNRRDPSARGQYRVIRGDGKFVASGGPESDDFPGILTSIYRNRIRRTGD